MLDSMHHNYSGKKRELSDPKDANEFFPYFDGAILFAIDTNASVAEKNCLALK